MNNKKKHFRNVKYIALFIVAILSLSGGSVSLFAADNHNDDEGWKGEVTAGGLSTSGNVRVQTLNGTAKATHNGSVWRLEGIASALFSSDKGARTAERYDGSLMAGYKLSERAYAFVWTGAEKQLFSGYQYRLVESIGVGYIFIQTDSYILNINTSVGGRQSKLTTGGKTENEALGRAEASYNWVISPTSNFSESVVVEGGKKNVVSESTTALTLKVYGDFDVRLGFHAQYTSKVPTVFIRKLDTESTVNVVYNF